MWTHGDMIMHMSQLTRPSSTIIHDLFSTKPLPEPILAHYNLDLWQFLMKFQSKYKISITKMSLQINDICSMRVCLSRPQFVSISVLQNRKERLEYWCSIFHEIETHMALLGFVLFGLHYLCWLHINGFVKERCTSSALAMELHLSCTNP